MFKVWLEWDYGQDNLIFSTKEKAIQWVNEYGPDYTYYDELLDEGLCSIQELIVDPTS